MYNRTKIFKLDDPKKWIFIDRIEKHILVYCHINDTYIYKYIDELSGRITYFDYRQVLLYNTAKHEFIDQLEYTSLSPIKHIVNLLYETCVISENGTYKRDTTFIVGIKKLGLLCYKVKWVSVYHNDYCKIHKDRSIKCYAIQTSKYATRICTSKKMALNNSKALESTQVDTIESDIVTKRAMVFHNLIASDLTAKKITSGSITADKLNAIDKTK